MGVRDKISPANGREGGGRVDPPAIPLSGQILVGVVKIASHHNELEILRLRGFSVTRAACSASVG